MKRVVMMLALALVIPALAMASDFTYNTTGTFQAGAGCVVGASSCTFTSGSDSVTISFAGHATDSGFVPTSVDLGVFTISSTSSNPVSIAGANFSLNLFQTAPAPGGSGQFVGAFEGTIRQGQSNGDWYFSPSATVVTINGPGGLVTTYKLRNLDTCGGNACIIFGKPGATPGTNTITADVTQVPEPASIMLLGTGLSGLAGVIRRRMKK